MDYLAADLIESSRWTCTPPTASDLRSWRPLLSHFEAIQAIFTQSSWDKTQLHLQSFSHEVSRIQSGLLDANTGIYDDFPSLKTLTKIQTTVQRCILVQQVPGTTDARRRRRHEMPPWLKEISDSGIGECINAIAIKFSFSWRPCTSKNQVDFASRSAASKRNGGLRPQSHTPTSSVTPGSHPAVGGNSSGRNARRDTRTQRNSTFQGDWTF